VADPNLSAAAAQAGLTPKQKAQIDGLSKLMDSHKKLSAMPEEQGKQAFGSLSKNQQKSHESFFGGDTGNPLGKAFGYLTSTAKTVIAAPFKALNEISDLTTRVYRTGAIALDQGIDIGQAWDTANDKGDQVFSPKRIQEAEEKYGKDIMSVAVKIASGVSTREIQASGTDEEKLIVSQSVQNKLLLQDAIDAAQAAKYSPGRQLANLLLPGSMEGSGALYRGISGTVDAAYRIFADPTLQLGKAKKAYDAGNWALFTLLGKEKYTYGRSIQGLVNNEAELNRVFSNPQVTNLFDTYGAQLDTYAKAKKAEDLKTMAEAGATLKRLVPEFGPSTIDELTRAGVKNAETAKTYLLNVGDMTNILSGQAGRKTALLPKLDAARKARVNFLTAADRVFDINKVGQPLVKAYYGLEPKVEDVITSLTQKSEVIAAGEKNVGKLFNSGAFRLNNDQIRGRIDRFARKFSINPYFANDFFDVNSKDASKKIYQLSMLGFTRYHSKIIQEAFVAGTEGQKEKIFEGIWKTLGEVKGWNQSSIGKEMLNQQFTRVQQYAPEIAREIIDEVTGEVSTVYKKLSAFGPNEIQSAVLDWQLSSGMRVPNIAQLDTAVAKETLLARKFGINYKSWIEKITGLWTFGTLAGPRTVARNASEDLLLHSLIGESPFTAINGRFLANRIAKDTPEAKSGMIARITSKFDRTEVGAKIDKALVEKDNNLFQAIVANQLVKDSLGGALDPKTSSRMEKHFLYANKETFNSLVSDGAKNAMRGASQYMKITNDVNKYGARMGALEVDGIAYKQATGVPFTNINPVVSQENRVSWLFTLTANANSDLGSLAIKYMKPGMDEATRRKVAVDNIRQYLDNLPEASRGRFKLYSEEGENTTTHAAAIYDTVRTYLSKENGDLNENLLSKIRFIDEKGNVQVSAKELSLNDIPGLGAYGDAPKFISGPSFVPLTGDDFTGGFIQWGWDAMAKGNAELSRIPMANYELSQTLKAFDESGFEKRFIERATRGLTGEKKILAETNANKQLAAIAEDIAANRVLAFVDNPEIRSQLAMSVRNFARFYRATEDFYRRMVRTVRYNPEALARASLTYEGITHSGWVRTDENGDQYFFYPGLTPVYSVMNKMAKVFGVKDGFQTGMPVEFGAKLKMITPSMNPDSLFPTFAGPVAALPIKMIGNIVPQVNDLEKYLTGNYGQDQPMISALLPAHLNRFLQTLSTDERSSQYASAARKAATYLEATGHGIKTQFDEQGNEIAPSPGELAAYQDKLQGSTTTVLALRFIFGFFAPASPSINLKSDMAAWAKDNGEVSYKSLFNGMIEKYNGDIDKAVGEWIKYYPDQMPYTISESESNVVANVRAVDSANQWVNENAELLAKYPEAASFLIPQAGSFDFNAYKLLFSKGLKQNKSVSDFVRQVSVAKDKELFYQKKEEYDLRLTTAVTVAEKRIIRQEWQDWSDDFKGVRPLLQEELAKGASSNLQRAVALKDLRNMLADPAIETEPATRKVLKRMLTEYDNYASSKEFAAMPGSGVSQEYKDMLKQNALDTLKSLAGNDANALAAYNSLFAPLFR
jgi:hypothetical protein